MKKFILTLVIAFMMAFTANAQIATENAKLFDNVSVGVEAGVSTPLDFNSVFPLNTVAGLKIGKDFTPEFGVEAEGQVFFNDNNVGRWTSTFVKGTNVGLNGIVNLSNLFGGYLGTPRTVELRTNTGLGWLHRLNSGGNNALTAKTALDLDFNLGNKKAHVIEFSPGVYWVIGDQGRKIQFNKNLGQLALFVSYKYRFNTSNGTHNFKTYDVGAMINEIDRLNSELAKKPTEVERTIVKEVEVPIRMIEQRSSYIFFAQDSYVISDYGKATLDNIDANEVVDVIAYASPEGTDTYNKALSERRAAAVADYLTKRGVTVNSWNGYGTVDETTGRVAIVTVK